MRTDLGRLRMQRGVDIHRFPARRAHACHGLAQQHAAVGALEGRIGIRKVTPDIAQASGPKQRVGNRVQQDVRIRMPQQAMRVGNRHAADDQRAALDQRMHVKALADAERNTHNHFSISSKSSGHVTLKLRMAPGTSSGA